MCVYRNCVVLPGVLRAVEVPFDLGGVMPTWAVMPLLQEPDWDIWASAVTFWPASSYWPCAWEEEDDEEGFQREELLLGSMLASSSSSTFFKSWAPAQLLLTSGSACLDLLPFWDWRVVEMDVILMITWWKIACLLNIVPTHHYIIMLMNAHSFRSQAFQKYIELLMWSLRGIIWIHIKQLETQVPVQTEQWAVCLCVKS